MPAVIPPNIMEVIHDVKGAKIASQVTLHSGANSHLEFLSGRIAEIARRPWADSSKGIVLGCTELPVLFPDDRSKNKFSPEVIVFSSTDILAEAVVRFAYGDNTPNSEGAPGVDGRIKQNTTMVT